MRNSKILNILIVALIATIGIVSTVSANETTVPLTYSQSVSYEEGVCYPNSGCWTAETVTVTNTDTTTGDFSLWWEGYCDACNAGIITLVPGQSYAFKPALYQKGNPSANYRVISYTRKSVVEQTNNQQQDTSISDPNSWIPKQGESCWSSGDNLGSCSGKVAIGLGGIARDFTKGFVKGFFNIQ